MRCIKDRDIILKEWFAYNEWTQEEYQTRRELKEEICNEVCNKYQQRACKVLIWIPK
jgi:hypothetical protein